MIKGISHLTFIVTDLEAMEEILVSILDAQRVYDSGQETFSLSSERFYVVGEDMVWIAIMEGNSDLPQSYNHVAFEIDDAALDEKTDRIRALGLEVREGRPRVEGEGRSIYFYDRDNHLFELHSGSLEERLKRYQKG